MNSNQELSGRMGKEYHGGSPYRLAQWITVAVAVFFSALLWLKVPAADFDEALYADMAKVMHRTGEYIQPIWDDRAMYDKPPLFIWTLLPFAENFHPAEEWPGLMRLGNLLSSFAVAAGAAWLIRSSSRTLPASVEQGGPIRSASPRYGYLFLLYFCALLPFLGMGLLLIDLLLCLFLFPVFALLDEGFRRQAANQAMLDAKSQISTSPSQVFLTVKQSLVAGALIAVAAATKGLIAWIIPGLAAVCMSLWTRQGQTVWQTILLAVRRFWILFLVAVLGTASFYAAIWYAGHQEFVRSFFVDHHFGRGSSAMEGHSGSLLYHVLVVWVGGGWMSAALLAGLRQRWCLLVPQSRHGDFALWWFLVTIGFFSLIATKLPNYTWPVWMVLPVVVVRLFGEGQSQVQWNGSQPRWIFFHRLADWATRLLAVLYFLIGSCIALFPFSLSLLTEQDGRFYSQLQRLVDPRVLAIISGNRFSYFESLSCYVVAICFFGMSFLILRVGSARSFAAVVWQAPVVVMVQAVLMVFVISGVLPLGKRAYLDPILLAAERASSDFPTADVLTFGIKSPSFSSAYLGSGRVTQVSWDSDFDKSITKETLLVMPSWTNRNCYDRAAEPVQTMGFLVVCLKRGVSSP